MDSLFCSALGMVFGALIILMALVILRGLRRSRLFSRVGSSILADRTVAGVLALIFLVGILVITGMVAYRYMLYGDPSALEGVKTIWAVLGTPLGAILMYYFKS